MRAMDTITRMTSHFDDAIDALALSRDVLAAPLADAVDIIFAALANNAKILACGNADSAADAQRLVARLVGRFERERLPLAGLALGNDTSILTAVGNDYGFEEIFERQVNALGQAGDILVCISTTGNCANVLRAVGAAHEREMPIIALTGNGGGVLGELMTAHDVHVCVPHDRTTRIQEVHNLLLHALCDGIDALLLGEPHDSSREK